MSTRSFRLALLIATVGLVPLLAACGEDGTAREVLPEEQATVTAVSHHGEHDASAVDDVDHRGEHVVHTDHTENHDHADHATDAATGGHDHGEHQPALAATELPGTSLFHLGSAWTNSNGGAFRLPDLRGRHSVIVMFYGDCTTACPLLVKTAEDIEAALPVELQGGVDFVMVTFATQADTPGRLKDYSASKDLDRDNWHWLVGSDLQTRQLATLLGVQYRDLGNGMFAHSNVVTVLDANGVPAARLEGLGVDTSPAIRALMEAR